MKFQLIILSSIITFITACGSSPEKYQTKASDSVNLELLSQDLLYAVRTNDSLKVDTLKEQLRNSSIKQLKQLKSDSEKNAFWINIYNAYIQDILGRNAGEYEDRGSFFASNQIPVAGYIFSFDFIEHGILRRSKNKLSLGYFNKLFPSSLEKDLRVENPDYRIHFALNCGANSCPPIAFYSSKEINKQLAAAEVAFITARAEVNEDEKTVEVSRIFSWFRGDFGGKSGIKELLIKHKVITNDSYRLDFAEYNWDLELAKYRE